MITEIQKYLDEVSLDKSAQTVRSYKQALVKFFEFLKIEDYDAVKLVSQKNCRDFQNYLIGTGIKKSSINQYVRSLKVYYNYLVNTEEIVKSPFDKVKFMKDTHKNLTYLTDEETDKILNSCSNIEEKTIIAMMLTLGLRRSELVNLKVENIKGNEVEILGKGGKTRFVYFSPEFKSLFNEYVNSRKDKKFEYVFRSKMGSKYSGQAIYDKVKKVAKLAKLDQERIGLIGCHSMRRTCATNMVDNGTPVQVIQGVLGHSSVNTTMRYANLRPATIKNAMINQKNILNKEK